MRLARKGRYRRARSPEQTPEQFLGHPGRRNGVRLYLEPKESGPPPQEQVVCLISWAIVSVAGGEMYVVGYALDTNEGCVSPRITSIDSQARTVITQGGHTFELAGQPGLDFYGRTALMLWANLKRFSKIEDVTHRIIEP